MSATRGCGRPRRLVGAGLLLLLVVASLLLGPGTEAARKRGGKKKQRLASCVQVEAFKKKLEGNVCPYTVSKMVSCKVTNGTETYTGKVAIGKRVQFMTMTRPRYVTSFKEVQDTEYGCCPGFYGDNCDNSCFNCTQIHNLLSRVRTLEAKLLRSPSASLPPLDDPVIEMGLPDTSHVNGHPLNHGRGRGRNRSSNRSRGQGSTSNRRRDRGNGSSSSRRRSSSGGRWEEDPRGDIDIVEDGGTDAYDVDRSPAPPRPTLTSPPIGTDQCACPAGPAGPPGAPGIPGRDGQPGIDGRDGNPGQPGLPGSAAGVFPQETGNGLEGEINYISGPPGPPGITGPPGPRGIPGKDGLIGPPGPQGLPGPNGRDGSPGLPGSPGPKGVPGESIQGPKGNPGLGGLPGEQGPVGPQGPAGIIGPTGPKGEAGLIGIAGTPGQPGPKGEIGPVGATGLAGKDGQPGPPGQPGLPGPPGPPGPARASFQNIVPDGLGDYNGGLGYGIEGSGFGISIDDDEYPIGIPGLPLPRGHPGPPGPKGDPGRPGSPGPKGDRGFEGVRGPPDGAEARPIQELFQTVALLRENLNLLDARVRILETELPKIIGLAGEENRLPGYPDAPYDPSPRFPSSIDSLSSTAGEIFRQVDRLNGLVNSDLPKPDGGFTPSLNLPPSPDSSLTFPVELNTTRGRDNRVDVADHQPLLPERRAEFPSTESPLTPVTQDSTLSYDDLNTVTEENEGKNYLIYGDYDDNQFEYDENKEYEYEYYDYGTRRKRQPGKNTIQNDEKTLNGIHNSLPEGSEDNSSSVTIKKHNKWNRTGNITKIKNIQKQSASSRSSKNSKVSTLRMEDTGKTLRTRLFNLSSKRKSFKVSPILRNTTTQEVLKQDQQPQKVRQKSNRKEDIHPLRRIHFLRSRRESGFPFKKSSVGEITWI